MVAVFDLKKISDYEWEIPRSYRDDMRVPVRVFVTQELLEQAMRDKSLEQAVNAATLPGLVGYVTVMPDMHQGYGFPIGGVAATRYPDGVVSPGAIGYDINCGVRLLGSQIEAEALLFPICQHCISCLFGVPQRWQTELRESLLELLPRGRHVHFRRSNGS